MAKPRLLDLFCGAGGAAMGYHRAGFEVAGVDIVPMHSYPFWDLIQGDALSVLADVDFCRGFDLIHASPPCQAWCAMAHLTDVEYPRLIVPVRDALRRIGRPYVIENVPGAESALLDPVMLCGTMFGQRIRRHRLFESSLPLPSPPPCGDHAGIFNPHNRGGRDAMYAESGRTDPESRWRAEMGVEWMHRYEAREAIPPAYTEWIGKQLLAHLAILAKRD